MTEHITIGISTLKERQDSLRQTLRSLTTQSVIPSVVYVYMAYDGVPAWHGEFPSVEWRPLMTGETDAGDAGKYNSYEAIQAVTGGYYFTCDDDIVYPPDYIKTMIAAIERHGRRAVVCVHGWDTKPAQASYHRDRAAWYHYSRDLDVDTPCHIAGSLAAAWHTSTLPDLSMADFQRPNMCDLWFSRHCNERSVPRIVIAHRAGWLQNSTLYDMGKSIWATYSGDRERERFQTETLNATEWNYGEVRV